jgi:hypothetical protein
MRRLRGCSGAERMRFARERMTQLIRNPELVAVHIVGNARTFRTPSIWTEIAGYPEPPLAKRSPRTCS